MVFKVLSSGQGIPSNSRNKAFLRHDGWDDWFKYSTLYSLTIADNDGELYEIGYVKIGEFGMKKGHRTAEIPLVFEELDPQFFSLGQGDEYYENLSKLGGGIRDDVLISLRDLALNEELLEEAKNEDVFIDSLARSITLSSIRGQFRRIAKGGARLTDYNFIYRAPKVKGSGEGSLELSFKVTPSSSPPTNIHVLIGRNGVGKTHILNLMSQALVDPSVTSRKTGSFAALDNDESDLFSNLVSVTFSAFDHFEPISLEREVNGRIRYSYVGLKKFIKSKGTSRPKSPEMLGTEFSDCVCSCLEGAKKARWLRAVEMLSADPLFNEVNVSSLKDVRGGGQLKEQAGLLYKKLSSGHKIVLLTITKLVETVEEKTLVLLDEPEAHLHPPLLSAFIRALSDLLVDRNGVAIIATHSPVVLQEAPKSCVWKLRRSGPVAKADRPEIETFGENVGVLTREVFGFEVTQTGFHKLLEEALSEEREYDELMYKFDGQIGAEGRAIARAIISASE